MKQKIPVRLVYEKVTLAIGAVEQRRFFSWLNDVITEIRIMFQNDDVIKVVVEEDINFAKELTDMLNIDILFLSAIVDDILFMTGAGEEYKNEFMRKSQLAYHKLLSGKYRVMKRLRW